MCLVYYISATVFALFFSLALEYLDIAFVYVAAALLGYFFSPFRARVYYNSEIWFISQIRACGIYSIGLRVLIRFNGSSLIVASVQLLADDFLTNLCCGVYPDSQCNN
jgi:hypothetical protein